MEKLIEEYRQACDDLVSVAKQLQAAVERVTEHPVFMGTKQEGIPPGVDDAQRHLNITLIKLEGVEDRLVRARNSVRQP